MEFEVVPVTRFAQNCSIVWCKATRRAAVIDPGGDIAGIVTLLEVMELDLEVALVTHGHLDHCGGAARLAELTGARIEGPHRGDAGLVANVHRQRAFFAEMLDEKAAREPVPRTDPHLKPYVPARWLEDGDQVRFGNETLAVLHCPGHTAGHVVYFHKGQRLAFVGDILFRDAIGMWELPGGDLPVLVHSIRSRLFPLGDDVRFVPGHGPMSTFGRERRENPFVGDGAEALWGAVQPRPIATATQ